ncbi:uncharacterized protein LOC111822155 [Trichechus manatus latirostris]|uniref:Uncharacterized protein LOC111822155 n=1 Tax=Trichechus manatus latirostris TaxID=127582 RepID=A0A2Y9RUB4_TRIMA|nr:uncharacterized protein LOC111822155 [Trichechus manatus latirostris]
MAARILCGAGDSQPTRPTRAQSPPCPSCRRLRGAAGRSAEVGNAPSTRSRARRRLPPAPDQRARVAAAQGKNTQRGARGRDPTPAASCPLGAMSPAPAVRGRHDPLLLLLHRATAYVAAAAPPSETASGKPGPHAGARGGRNDESPGGTDDAALRPGARWLQDLHPRPIVRDCARGPAGEARQRAPVPPPPSHGHGHVHLVREKMGKRFFALKVVSIPQVIRLKQKQHVHKSVLEEVSHPFLVPLENGVRSRTLKTSSHVHKSLEEIRNWAHTMEHSLCSVLLSSFSGIMQHEITKTTGMSHETMFINLQTKKTKSHEIESASAGTQVHSLSGTFFAMLGLEQARTGVLVRSTHLETSLHKCADSI